MTLRNKRQGEFMVTTRTEVLHEPKLDTILMVEKPSSMLINIQLELSSGIACPEKCNTKPSNAY